MRRLIPFTLFALVLAAAVPPASWSPDPEQLLGAWRVDLRPTPDAPASYADFVVTQVASGSLAGSFYRSEVEDGRINTDWGAVHFAFVTRDDSGVYHTSGVLRDGVLTGTTHSLGRGFLAVWSATRVDEKPSD